MYESDRPGQAACIEKKPGPVAAEIPGKRLLPFNGSHNTFIVTDSQASLQNQADNYYTNQTDNVGSFSCLAGDFSELGGQEKPPLLIGGSQHIESSILNQKGGFSVFGCTQILQVKFHWLTVTTGPKISKMLCEKTEIQETMGKRPGFNFSERRICWGGHCDRHFGPKQKEKKYGFGLEYESWVFPGEVSSHYVNLLLDQDVKSRPSRLDVAFDFITGENTYPRDIVDSVRSYVEKKRFGINAGGDEKTGTRYIGSREKDRFIRIYRKDLESKAVSQMYGPVMRIEIELKNKAVRAFWRVLESKGIESAFRQAAAHIKVMTSMIVLPGILPEIPELEDTDSELINSIFHLVCQYGSKISVMKAAGIDLDALFQAKADNMSRFSRSRMREMQEIIRNVDVQEINQRLYDAIISHT